MSPLGGRLASYPCQFMLTTTVRLQFRTTYCIVRQTYVKNTHGATHGTYTLEIEDAFVIEREGEDARFKPFEADANRQLLWHGSRLSNYVGILSQGAHCLAFHSFVLCPGGAQVYNHVLRLPCLAFAQHAEHRYSVTTASVCLLLPCLFFSIYNFCADTLRAQCL